MPSTFVLLAIPMTIALAYGYRTLTALLVLRSLPSDNADSTPWITDGEPAVLTGELVVEEPVETTVAAVKISMHCTVAVSKDSNFGGSLSSPKKLPTPPTAPVAKTAPTPSASTTPNTATTVTDECSLILTRVLEYP